MPVYFASTGPVSCQCWYRYWASTLRQYWPNAEPLLPQHWANTACRYWASTGPIHCASTGPMLDQHWPNTGAVPHASIGPIHSRCATYALGQCRLYRPASIGQYWPNTLRQHWPNAGPALAQHWGSTTCQHWPDSQPLCSVCIGPMLFIPACQYWPSTGPILSCLLGPKLSYNSPSYGSECWWMAELNLKHLSTFHKKSLQNILRTLFPKNSTKEPLRTRQQTPIYRTTYLVDRWMLIYMYMYTSQLRCVS